jgi:hypothetical protein
MGITCEDLQKTPCAECPPGTTTCTLVLSPRCHKGSGVTVMFHKHTNSFEMVCATCKAPVATIDVPRQN